MLQAILSGKRRGSGLERSSIGVSSAVGSEDILTSIVFERIAYLDSDGFKAFFAQLLPFATPVGELVSMEFWPRLELGERIVEPDVVLTCESALVLVEAKRWDTADMQSPAQIASELLALQAEAAATSGLPVVTVLVGGRQDTSERSTHAFKRRIEATLHQLGESALEFSLVAVRWSDILTALERIPNQPMATRRIVEDVERGMAFHAVAGRLSTRLFNLNPRGIESVRFPALAGGDRPRRRIAETIPPNNNTARIWQLAPASIGSESFDRF
jgi:hypothetical protein